MHAFLHIQKARKALENIDFVSMLSLGQHGSKRDLQRRMERWAKEADVGISFEED